MSPGAEELAVRLTLRTLLAYLDDTLEPGQAREIGQKLAESPTAQELVARIKQVTRRRRLTTPSVGGPGSGLDANTIAEYLDNELPPDRLAEVEETCLASDVHLAEVAACHQILTLVLGQPALVPPTARERMYALVRGRESVRSRRASATAVGHGATADGAAGQDDTDEALLLGLPLYGQRQWLRWAVPLAAACLLVTAGIALWMALSGPPQPQPRPTGDGSDRRVAVAPNGDRPKTTPSPTESAVTPTATTPTEPARSPDTKTEPAAEPKAKPEVKTPTAPTPAAGAKPQAPPPVQPPSTERRELGRASLVAGPPSVLLQHAEGKPWVRVRPQRDRVASVDQLVSLPGYRSEVRLDSGVYLTLWGSLPEFSGIPVLESAVVLHANPAFDLDFTLDHGRVVLANHKSAGPARVRARFLGEVWDLTLSDPETELSLELIGTCLPYTREPGGGEPMNDVALVALRGHASVRIRYEEYALPAPALFRWDNASGPERQVRALPRPPDWFTGKNPQTPAAKAMTLGLDELSKRLAAKENVDVVLAESMHGPDANGRVLSVRSLGAMGDFARLIDALSDERFFDLRLTAIEELHHLLGFGLKNDEKLAVALKQKNYSEGQAQTVLQLLHQFSEQQWADPTTRTAVVEYLNHDKLAIRQLTHSVLLTLAPEGQKIPYDPAGDSRQRERGYEEWKKLVTAAKQPARNGG